MLLRSLALSFALVGLFLFPACSDKPAAAPQTPPAAAKPESALRTSGVLHFDGLPPGSVSVAEVLIVSSLSDEARERILRQRVLFEYKVTGRVEEVVATGIEGVSSADSARLEARLAKLPAMFPPIRVDDIDLGNNRLRKYQSDPELLKEYKYLFASIKWDNLERGLNFINDKIEADSQALLAAQSGETSDDVFEQAAVTLKWLESVQRHRNDYVALAMGYVDAKNRYLKSEAQAGPPEPTDWDSYVTRYSNRLIMDTSEYLEGSSFAAEDGSFEAVGHGIVVVRVELGGVSAYFLPESEDEQRVRIENLQQF